MNRRRRYNKAAKLKVFAERGQTVVLFGVRCAVAELLVTGSLHFTTHEMIFQIQDTLVPCVPCAVYLTKSGFLNL